MKVDTAAIDQEIANYEKQLRQHYSIKTKLAEEIDSLDPDDRHYVRRKADLDDRLYRMYDKIEEMESLLIAARAKKQAIEAEKLTGDNIYKVLIYFEKLYGVMNDVERRQLIEALISEIQIYPERQPNGQWLKSIKFKLPIIEEDMSISLDNEEQVDAVVQRDLAAVLQELLAVILRPSHLVCGGKTVKKQLEAQLFPVAALKLHDRPICSHRGPRGIVDAALAGIALGIVKHDDLFIGLQVDDGHFFHMGRCV